MKWIACLLLLSSSYFSWAAPPPAKSDREKSPYQGGYPKKDFELPAEWPIPQIEGVKIKSDVKVGFNLSLKLSAFDFDIEHLGEAGYPLKSRSKAFGYVHLYVNGKKRNRLYGPHFYLKEIDLEPGKNQLEFTLANHLHGVWRSKGKAVSYRLEVTRPNR
jgi:hypothetical protein